MTNVPPDPWDRHGPPDASTESAILEPDRDLPGAVMMIPNRHWGFETVSAVDHPGVCLNYSHARREGLLLMGTDVDHMRHPHLYYVVEPTPVNGLQKLTAFRLVPRYFRWHRLQLYFPQRHIGRLDERTLLAIRDELARLNPQE